MFPYSPFAINLEGSSWANKSQVVVSFIYMIYFNWGCAPYLQDLHLGTCWLILVN